MTVRLAGSPTSAVSPTKNPVPDNETTAAAPTYNATARPPELRNNTAAGAGGGGITPSS
ncbi:hypothetical protein GCM10022255_116610 [Dactylosporangium darangshiense]|uniref:Uncharacterized protein n=1 Tax=Dactylosporangium darangshiense TaxID=579108 RepID=A0ABP8DWA0_9ACTN